MTISEPTSSKTLIRKAKGKRDFGQTSIQAALGKLAAKHEPTADYDLNVDMKDCSSVAVALDKLVRECRRDPAYRLPVRSSPYGFRIRFDVTCTAPSLLDLSHPLLTTGEMESGTALAYTIALQDPRTG